MTTPAHIEVGGVTWCQYATPMKMHRAYLHSLTDAREAGLAHMCEFATLEQAEGTARLLRKHGFDATAVEGPCEREKEA